MAEQEEPKPVKSKRVVYLPVHEDETGGKWQPVRFYYDCPLCGLITHVDFNDTHDEGVPEGLEAGTVPVNDWYGGEVRPCETCQSHEVPAGAEN